ncbi:MAG TPA: ABC transporter ATP-binding protein [Candidatus Chromulinivoraceae bacterium]|nr:ABC transporter ATP-binding protein [Candidatus Chromulinivoraceae bacterium]
MAKILVRTDTKTARKTLTIFWTEIAKDKRRFIFYSTLVPINRLLYVVLLPFLFSLIVQSLILHPHDWKHPVFLLVIGTLVSVLAVLTALVGFTSLFRHEEEMRTTLIRKSMQHLMLHSDQFFANRKIGSLAGDVNTFGASIVSFFDIIFLQASGLVVNFIASLIIIAFMSPVLLIPLGLATILLIWRSLKAVSSRGPIRHKRKQMMSQLNGTVADILGNQQIVRYFANGTKEVDRVVTDRKKIENVMFDEIRIFQRETIARQAMLFALQLVTIGTCIWLATTGNVSIAALVFAISYLGRLTGSLFEITPIIRGMEQLFIDAANITDIIYEEPEIKDAPHAPSLVVRKGQVDLNSVVFHYAKSRDVAINDLTLHIKPGERIGLAGHSGGGKTTLTKLVLRFADVSSGSIEIDGQNIAEVSQDSLRSAIAYVPQEPYLFHRSLRDNIAYARPEAADEEIMQAVKQANAYEFIKDLPEGLDTIVGERGVKLSGGQRQRIAIARAILKNAPILILDEATSALDSESEKLIQDALEKLMKNRTSIVVAHRLSTIAKLDRIIVIKGGAIKEQGRHDQLLAQKGTYAKLWAHQSGGFIEE